VVVRGKRIAAVGPEAELAPFVPGAAEVVDLDGALILPAFQDSHVHPNIGGLVERGLDLGEQRSAEALLEAIRQWADGLREDAWVSGWGWGQHLFGPDGPGRGALDAVTGGRPAVLTRGDGHAAWANTEALRRAGVLEPVPDRPGGAVVRGPDGLALGLLQEEATALVESLVPEPTWAERKAALLAAQAKLAGFGIAAWQDASVSARDAGLYAELEAEGLLTATVIGALRWEDTRGLEQLASLEATRRATAGERFRPSAVKILYDGVVDGSLTAAVLEPYLDGAGAPTDNRGATFFRAEELGPIVAAITGAGFQTHFHALGDRAVREALDGIERAGVLLGSGSGSGSGPGSGPGSGSGSGSGPGPGGGAAAGLGAVRALRPILSHIQLIDPADIPRFAQLGAIASAQPLWAVYDRVQTDLTWPFIGPERAGRQYPFGELAAAGALLAGGSDWPVSTPDPLQGIHVAVNRSLWAAEAADGGPGAGPLGPDQAITLAEALTAYTAGSAWANHRETESGTLDPGKLADLAILDRDPFLGPPDQIGAARVIRTYASGREVFRA
jgi:predicted amidohydrolase YtcJ